MALDAVVVVDHDTYFAHREALEAWVRDHGINGRLIPIPSVIDVSDGRVTVEQYRRNADGALILGDDGRPVRGTLTVPLRRPLPLPDEPQDPIEPEPVRSTSGCISQCSGVREHYCRECMDLTCACRPCSCPEAP
ncbi:hypothetical protein [Micromonospora thermarum]|uniref:Uncharacterized protein n=1 Tax=Micromonospora thermarum TaxID=2720024 RepID=A0ABX0Z760_9ACTN|nr:hypothetical protein [Micromonospora thermarum]NJP33687.1 hypothetical protein [Micromonospora thermarum]